MISKLSTVPERLVPANWSQLDSLIDIYIIFMSILNLSNAIGLLCGQKVSCS